VASQLFQLAEETFILLGGGFDYSTILHHLPSSVRQESRLEKAKAPQDLHGMAIAAWMLAQIAPVTAQF